MKRLIIFIALSLGLHVLLKSGLFSLADFYLADHPILHQTEIDLIEEPTETHFVKPIIKQLAPLQPVDNDDSQARFDSEKTQRVKKETKARDLGLTKNTSATKMKSQKPEPQNNDNSPSELPEFTRMNYSGQSESSAVSQTLPKDIEYSNATNLNTDANTYYSFYSRVEELFYVRWSERLNYYWNRIAFDFKKNMLAGKTWSTTLEVLLTSTGEFHSATIFRSSGYKPFDEAAVFAFKDARFFPNPPKAKIDPDGFVRLKYKLSVMIGTL